MKALLLSAGKSKRNWPIGDKNLLNFCGQSLIEHQISQLIRAGFLEIGIVTNSDNLEKIKKITTNFLNLKFEFFVQKNSKTGMSGAVLAAKNFFKTKKEILIFSGNDVVSPSVFLKMLQCYKKNSDAQAFVLAKKTEKYFPGGYLKVDKNFQISEIIEKPGKILSPGIINIVVHLFRQPKKFLEEIKKITKNNLNNDDDFYEKAFSSFCKQEKVLAVPFRDFWQPIKFPWHILDLQTYFLKKLSPKISSSSKVSKTAILKGPVFIDDDVEIFDYAVLIGPVFIGKKVKIGNFSLVRESIIGENSIVGAHCEIARSFLGKNNSIHRSYFGDSILAGNSNFGAGTISGNLRFDEKDIFSKISNQNISTDRKKFGTAVGENCKIGIGVKIFPGIKIGKKSFISPGAIVKENIPENSFLKRKNGKNIIYENRK